MPMQPQPERRGPEHSHTRTLNLGPRDRWLTATGRPLDRAGSVDHQPPLTPPSDILGGDNKLIDFLWRATLRDDLPSSCGRSTLLAVNLLTAPRLRTALRMIAENPNPLAEADGRFRSCVAGPGEGADKTHRSDLTVDDPAAHRNPHRPPLGSPPPSLLLAALPPVPSSLPRSCLDAPPSSHALTTPKLARAAATRALMIRPRLDEMYWKYFRRCSSAAAAATATREPDPRTDKRRPLGCRRTQLSTQSHFQTLASVPSTSSSASGASKPHNFAP